MVEIGLVAMTDDEYDEMIGASVIRYAEENVKAGYWTVEESLKRSQDSHDMVIPKGRTTEGHHFLKATDPGNGAAVGNIWYKEESGPEHRGFIYDVFIKEEHRGKGYGRAMMMALESLARSEGISSLALHVFFSNKAAVNLYGSLGYETKSMNMVKRL